MVRANGGSNELLPMPGLRVFLYDGERFVVMAICRLRSLTCSVWRYLRCNGGTPLRVNAGARFQLCRIRRLHRSVWVIFPLQGNFDEIPSI